MVQSHLIDGQKGLPEVVSDIVNYANIQIFDISRMSDILKHLINYFSNIFGVSDIVNYSIIQLSDISCMYDVLNHLNILCPLNIQSGLAWIGIWRESVQVDFYAIIH